VRATERPEKEGVRSSAPAGYSYNGNGVALKWGRFKWRRWVDGLQSQGVHRRRRTATSVGKRECGRNGDTREGPVPHCEPVGPHASKERRISVERREPRADGLSGVGDMRRLAKKSPTLWVCVLSMHTAKKEGKCEGATETEYEMVQTNANTNKKAQIIRLDEMT
jgi:hypothetical protein